MATLANEHRNKLERVIIEARDAAEVGARVALEALAIHEPNYYPHMSKTQQDRRNHLRARARQLGDRQGASGRLSIDHLVGECAYEYWHRMLFARFLAENGLLIEPQENIVISLAEAEELAREDDVDVWVFASRCAQKMLPQIFRPEDPLLQVPFAKEHRIKLEGLLNSLLPAVFTASDALGWVYQFWQSKKKDEVNRSEVKIGADEIAAVTQLFTEPYMVEFLLHNTLGAWWAGKNLAAKDTASAKTEDELRRKLSLPGVGWESLRFVRGADGENGPWWPAAGAFDGWPRTAAELKVLDPCCGSGHFLVAALHHLVPIRMAKESLSPREAVDAVLRDNLHGLEIDERCCQIAAFALAFTAWTYPRAGGYRPLPDLHIACSGVGPECSAEQWLKLAEQSGIPMPTDRRETIKNGLLNLHRLFSKAPTLGSLINPSELPADLLTANYQTIQPYLATILKAEKADDETRERAIAAAGMLKAVDLLAGGYTLVITNVPYLASGKQSEILRAFIGKRYRDSKADLGTVFIERSLDLAARRGTVAVVVLQSWLYLPTYKRLRLRLLSKVKWDIVARLGPGAFGAISGEVVNVCLFVGSALAPHENCLIPSIDVSTLPSPQEKADGLRNGQTQLVIQKAQLKNPDCRFVDSSGDVDNLLLNFADGFKGLSTGDLSRFIHVYWELPELCDGWVLLQGSTNVTGLYMGRHLILKWDDGRGPMVQSPACYVKGRNAWDKPGISIGQTTLKATIYTGEMFDENAAVIIVNNPKELPAIWAYCSSEEFAVAIRRVDRALKVTNKTLVKVPYDPFRWEEQAKRTDPDGLPEPESDDPTQWLFHGRPEESSAPLQVAVERLLGYRWPVELDDKMRLSKRARALVKRCDELAKFADDDGIVCIPSVRGEEPAAERLEALLAAAGVKPAKVRELAGGVDLDDWLRNGFFDEHCKAFHDRPFVWHIWDGRKRDGFHALVNYHKLCEGSGKGRKLLESLTYSYLGEWITRQKDGVKRGEGGAEDRLAAALELQKRLEAILVGEPPFDLFVRWKPLAEQPIGWEPDINDGVRMNVRPFLASDMPNGRNGAGVLRYKPNIKWTKDRGKEPQRLKSEYPWFWGWDEKTVDFLGGKEFDGNRWNDCHYTNKAKQAARETAKES